MSIQPPAPRLLTVAEYLAIGEIEHGYSELVEGRLVMSPNPSPLHNLASGEICLAVRRQLPADLLAVHGVDVDLGLAEPDAPGVSSAGRTSSWRTETDFDGFSARVA